MTLALLGSINILEVMVVILVAIVIFGKDLPRVAARGAVQFGRFRRMLQKMWRETGIEQEIRDVEAEIRSAVPRDVRPTDLARIATENIEQQLDAEESGDAGASDGAEGGSEANARAKEQADVDGDRREPA